MAALMIFFILMSRTIHGDLTVFERKDYAGPEFSIIRIYREYENYYFTLSDNYDWIEKSNAGNSEPLKGTIRERGLVFRGDVNVLSTVLEYIYFNDLPEYVSCPVGFTPAPLSRYTLIRINGRKDVTNGVVRMHFTKDGKKRAIRFKLKLVDRFLEYVVRDDGDKVKKRQDYVDSFKFTMKSINDSKREVSVYGRGDSCFLVIESSNRVSGRKRFVRIDLNKSEQLRLMNYLRFVHFQSLPDILEERPDKVEHVLEFTLTGRKNTDLIYKKVVVKDMESLMKNETKWCDELLNLKLLELLMSSLAENETS